jgi:hypothetical protein
MEPGAHLVQSGKVGEAAQMGDAATMNDGGADVIDELVLDQVLASRSAARETARATSASSVRSSSLNSDRTSLVDRAGPTCAANPAGAPAGAVNAGGLILLFTWFR